MCLFASYIRRLRTAQINDLRIHYNATTSPIMCQFTDKISQKNLFCGLFLSATHLNFCSSIISTVKKAYGKNLLEVIQNLKTSFIPWRKTSTQSVFFLGFCPKCFLDAHVNIIPFALKFYHCNVCWVYKVEMGHKLY